MRRLALTVLLLRLALPAPAAAAPEGTLTWGIHVTLGSLGIIVGNTISADLMDYLTRDHVFTGLPAALNACRPGPTSTVSPPGTTTVPVTLGGISTSRCSSSPSRLHALVIGPRTER